MFDLLLKETEASAYLHNSYLQSPFWAEFKGRYGWKSVQFKIESLYNGEAKTFFLTVLLRRIKFFGLLAYLPMAPCLPFEETVGVKETAFLQGEFLSTLSVQLKKLLPKDVFLLRFDPPWGTEADNAGGKCKTKTDLPLKPASKKIIKSFYDVQPPDTVILNLTLTEEELEAGFKPKWRYNIRLAEKKGIKVKLFQNDNVGENEIDIFYSLYEETAKRDGIAIHGKEYYKTFFETAKKYDEVLASLFIAEYREEPLAAIITVFYKTEAVYLYGASSNKHRNLMPAYLLQRHAIGEAKKSGCKTYDFYGIPPFDDPSHPMYGLYRFKTGFGGKIVHRVGSLDFPCKIFRYKTYSAAEKLRTLWFKKLKKIFKRK